MSLPSPRGVPYRIAMVCLGNICRSPMAHVVLAERLREAGLDERVEVNSAGTGNWHVGNPMDDRAAATLLAAGHDPSKHRARQFDPDWFDHDLILVMDRSNLRDVTAMGMGEVRLFREFDPDATPDDLEVPDPYFGGDDGFTAALAMIERTSDTLVGALRELLHG